MSLLSKVIDLVVDLAGRALNSPPKPLPPKVKARVPPKLSEHMKRKRDGGARVIVTKHRLDCDQKPSPNVGRYFAAGDPLAILMHFTAGASYTNALRTLRNNTRPPNERVSAHVLIGSRGECAQLVSLDRAAWHAGESEWDGRTRCNDWMLGIELDNPGQLRRGADGIARTYFKRAVAEPDVFTAPDGSLWQRFPEVQLAKLDEVVSALAAAYPQLLHVLGHSDVKPTKPDPGPAFPMARYRALLASGDRVA